MLRTLLIALDGSAASKVASEYALIVAKAHCATAIGLGALDEPGIHKPSYEPLGGGAFREARDKALLADANARVEAFLTEFANAAEFIGVERETMVRPGDPTVEIALASQRADVIVIARNAHFPFETEDAPDTLPKLLRNSPRPILVVPRRIDPGKGVLIAYDGSAAAARALQMFQLLELCAKTKVTVLGLADEIEEAEAMIAPALDFLTRHGVPPAALPIASRRKPAAVIQEEAARLAVELVVMGTLGRSPAKDLLMGSATKEILSPDSKFEIPVLVYH